MTALDLPHKNWWFCRLNSQTSTLAAERQGRMSRWLWLLGGFEFRSGEPPKSRIRVGFGFRVSGFGFRRLKPTFTVCFGRTDRNPKPETRNRLWRLNFPRTDRNPKPETRNPKPTLKTYLPQDRSKPETRNPKPETDSEDLTSPFGFRSVLGKVSLQSRFRVSGFGFRVSIGPGEVKSSESVSGFGFRVSGFDRSWGR